MMNNPFSSIPLKHALFDFYPPESSFKGIISIPHSGEEIPPEMEKFLIPDRTPLSKDVDTHVHLLIDIPTLQKNGIGIIKSHLHRTAIDLNRDPARSVLHWKKNTFGEVLVKESPSEDEEKKFREKYYFPYFDTLSALIHELEKSVGTKKLAPVVDLHSMPSRPTAFHLAYNPNQDQKRPDFCLSDLKGLSCEKEFILSAKKILDQYGYEVFINNPYFGGYLTEFINNFRTNNIQIEINRALYMDENTRKLRPDLANKLKDQLSEFFCKFF